MAGIDQIKKPRSSVKASIATVSEMIQNVEAIYDDTLILNVLQRFQNNADLSALPVLDRQQRFHGLVSRRHFLNLMTKAYARELFAQKSLAYLMARHKDVFAAPLIVTAEQRIDQVMVAFLSRDRRLQYDALPVFDADKVIGIVKIADMMLRLSQAQNRLIRTMKQLSERLNAEVQQAAALQRNLLRPPQIELPGVRGLATMLTSSEVGGDFYDYYMINNRWVVLLIGDVSGHGLAPGTIVCAAKAAVHFLQNEAVKDPKEILARLNNVIYNTANQALLMTMFAISLDTRKGEFRYANAGHQFGYLYRSTLGILETLEAVGLPLGKVPNATYENVDGELDLGDRLFLYTDAIVEEENDQQECFGYDRLEQLLSEQADYDLSNLQQTLLQHVRQHSGRKYFEDDITLLSVEYYERCHEFDRSSLGIANHHLRKPKLISESSYRLDPDIVLPHETRQDLILLSENQFSDLLPALARQGVRRVLTKQQPISEQLGWDTLLHQHHQPFNSDLATLLPMPDYNREFHFSHNEDKSFILEEIDAWLRELPLPLPERIDEVIFLLDEVIENGLYAAPRDGKGRALFSKGSRRQLADDEYLHLSLSLQQNLLGLTMTDSWGTLTPQVFLGRLSHHAQGLGMDAGVGGGGLYLIWRMSDYLQIRVEPNRKTQVSLFLDMATASNEDIDKGFQFFYHTEIQEALAHA